jgi:hypothetical protein
MGNIYRNFGGSGGTSPTPDPLEPYYTQLIALANNETAITAVTDALYPMAVYRDKHIYEYLVQLVAANAMSFTYNIDLPFNDLWPLIQQWLWGAPRKWWITFADTFADNQTLLVRNANINEYGEMIEETTISLEFQTTVDFVPTADFITVDLRGLSFAAQVDAICGALVANGHWSINTPQHYTDAGIYIQQLAVSIFQNMNYWDIAGTCSFVVSRTDYARAPLSSIMEHVGTLRDVAPAIPNVLVPLIDGTDPTYMSTADAKTVVNGRDFLWNGGTHLVRRDTNRVFRYAGHVANPDYMQLKPLLRKDNELLNPEGTAVALVTVPLDPEATLGTIRFPGNTYGPFEIVIEGFTECTGKAQTFGLLLNGVRLNGIYIESMGQFTMHDGSSGNVTGFFAASNATQEVFLTGGSRQNVTQGTDQLPFRIIIRCKCPAQIANEDVMSIKSRRRYFETETYFSEDASIYGGPSTMAEGKLWFREIVNGSAFDIGPLLSVGIVGLEYNDVSFLYEQAAIISRVRTSLFFTS